MDSRSSVLLTEDLAWLREHRKHVDSDVHQGFDCIVDDVQVQAHRVHRLEGLLVSAHEFMTGEWQPDDCDRQKFVREIADAMGLYND